MKTVLITGASSGLGRALAERFASEKYHIIGIAKTLAPLLALREAVELAAGSCDVYTADVADANGIRALYHDIASRHKHIDILINCAGIGRFGNIHHLADDDIEQMIAVNLLGTIYMTKHFLPIVHQKIVNVISTAGLRGKVNESVYCASKFGVRGFTESLQLELGDKLNVVAVYMGGMNTAFWQDSDHVKDTARLRKPEDVADVIYDRLIQGALTINV